MSSWKLPLFVSLLPRNVEVLQMHLWCYVTTCFQANIEHSFPKTKMQLYCDVLSLCKFGTLKSHLFLILSPVPLNTNSATYWYNKNISLLFDRICSFLILKLGYRRIGIISHFEGSREVLNRLNIIHDKPDFCRQFLNGSLLSNQVHCWLRFELSSVLLWDSRWRAVHHRVVVHATSLGRKKCKSYF